MAGLPEKLVLLLSLFALVLLSGCAEKQIDPVDPDNILVETASVTIREFNEKNVTVTVTNNDVQAINSVTVAEFTPLTVKESSSANLSGKKENTDSFILDARIVAPAFETSTNGSAVIITYLSGMDEKGRPLQKTKSVPANIVILPDAQLQFLGFVKDKSSLRTNPEESWELEAGDNATITYSVKNNGQSTIPAGMLTIVAEVDNESIALNASNNFTESIAKSGTSYTKGLDLPVNEDAPDGETDVYVKLMYGNYTVDEQSLLLKVKS
ncbi:MAG: hypothetical protein R2741_15340 [Methanolobus sp.]